MKKQNLVLVSCFAVILLTLSIVSAGFFTGKAVDYSTKLYQGNERKIPGTSDNIKIVSANDNSAIVSINGETIEVKKGATENFNGYSVYVRDIGKLFTRYWARVQVRELSGSSGSGSSSGNGKCVDSDGGLNQNLYGYIEFFTDSEEITTKDECVIVTEYGLNDPTAWESTNFCSGKDCYVEEAFCKTDEKGNFIDADATVLIACPNGCRNGACIELSSSTNTEMNYIDPTDCRVVYSEEKTRNQNEMIAKCDIDEVISLERVNCPIGYFQKWSSYGYMSTNQNQHNIPLEVGYFCMNYEGETTYPSSINVFCCKIKTTNPQVAGKIAVKSRYEVRIGLDGKTTTTKV